MADVLAIHLLVGAGEGEEGPSVGVVGQRHGDDVPGIDVQEAGLAPLASPGPPIEALPPCVR
jgi:hypothetical protein